MIIRKNFQFKNISWLGVGGNISEFIIIESLNELQYLKNIDKIDIIKIITIGNASNTLISDDGIDCKMLKFDLKDEIQILSENEIYIDAGKKTKDVIDFCLSHNLHKLEFFATIPGSIGGMIKMNAGCYGFEIKDVLLEIDYFDLGDFQIKTLKKDDINFEYRKSNLADNIIILGGKFSVLKLENNSLINNLIKDMLYKRKLSQPIAVKTCGSTFKNPANFQVWKLLDEVGLRGHKIGGAMFSEKHPNFMINFDNAKSEDFLKLMKLAEARIYEKFNIILEKEILIY